MIDRKRANYRFDEFELDLAKRRLLRGGEVVALKPKVFDLLVVLVENNGELLTKDDIFRRVWGDQFVEETNLTVSISAIRRALGETANEPRYITNVSGRGYYFTGDIVENGVIGESHSISRIVVESEQSDDTLDERGIELQNQMPPARSRGWLLAAGALISLIVIVGVGYSLFFRSDVKEPSPFKGLSVARVTTTGRAILATISPDGRTFAYVRQESDAANSLWVGQLDGSEQIQLRQPGYKAITGVNFSHDASRVYFVENKNPNDATVYRVPVLGGFVEKVTDDVSGTIALSPDDKQFVFVRQDKLNKKSRVMVADVDGNATRELAAITTDIGSFGHSVSWSPNGDFIAVAVYLRGGSPEFCEVVSIAVSDGSTRQVTNQRWRSVRSIVWTKASDGLLVAAGENSEVERQIWHVPFPVGEPRKLIADSNGYASLSVSADNSAVLAIQTQNVSNIWVAPASDLSAAKQVTFDMLGKQSAWYSVEWTDDGHIVFTGRTARFDTVYEIRADGSGQRQVLPESKRIESVSLPDDGSFLAFTSNRSGGLEIWRAARDGSDLVQLTHGGNNENVHVSPDGRYIVYRTGLGADGRLMRISAMGDEPLTLTDRLADWARFSPDSNLIACGYEVDGALKLAILSKDGGSPLSIFDVPETANFRLGVRWTPDGKTVTYRDWQNGIWKQEIAGGEPSRLEGLPAEKLFAYAWSRDGKWFAYGRGSIISDVVLLTSLQ